MRARTGRYQSCSRGPGTHLRSAVSLLGEVRRLSECGRVTAESSYRGATMRTIWMSRMSYCGRRKSVEHSPASPGGSEQGGRPGRIDESSCPSPRLRCLSEVQGSVSGCWRQQGGSRLLKDSIYLYKKGGFVVALAEERTAQTLVAICDVFRSLTLIAVKDEKGMPTD